MLKQCFFFKNEEWKFLKGEFFTIDITKLDSLAQYVIHSLAWILARVTWAFSTASDSCIVHLWNDLFSSNDRRKTLSIFCEQREGFPQKDTSKWFNLFFWSVTSPDVSYLQYWVSSHFFVNFIWCSKKTIRRANGISSPKHELELLNYCFLVSMGKKFSDSSGQNVIVLSVFP